jgi:hypothetical protein
MKDTDHKRFQGPYGRYFRACYEIENPEVPVSEDPWVRKLKSILGTRKCYANKRQAKKFMVDFPIYHELLSIFEDASVGSDKELLEACLISGESFSDIAKAINIPRFTEMFIGLYHELFYNVRPLLENDVLFQQHVILPLAQKDTDKLAVGSIWKMLSRAGGLKMLLEKGMTSSALRAEDISYLMQLCSYRNCTMMFRYASSGLKLLADYPNVNVVFDRLSDFDSIRGYDRRPDGFAKLTGVSDNVFNDMLTAGIKLIGVPEGLAEIVYRTDGVFNPEMAEAIEKPEHTLIDEVK